MFREMYIESIVEISINMNETLTDPEFEYIIKKVDINKPLTGYEEDKIANMIEELKHVYAM